MAEEIGIHWRVDDSELIASMRNYEQSIEGIRDKNEKFRKVNIKTFSKSKEYMTRTLTVSKSGSQVHKFREYEMRYKPLRAYYLERSLRLKTCEIDRSENEIHFQTRSVMRWNLIDRSIKIV